MQHTVIRGAPPAPSRAVANPRNVTEATSGSEVVTMTIDLCGECAVGQCDNCDMCAWSAKLPGARISKATVYPAAPPTP